MSDFKGIMKGGWHPKGKEGGKESWRGDFKGINQVAGWMGKGKQPGSGAEGSEHMSRPLATLKDPAAFGPPPRNVNYHGGAALPNQITPHTGGIGAPLTQAQIREAEEAVRRPTQEEIEAEEENARPKGPPLPYRADRTGLKTDHLPPPPIHRDVASSTSNKNVQAAPKSGPHLPPRLPSRQDSSSSSVATAPPPIQPPACEPAIQQPVPQPATTNGGLNKAALGRLNKAGISVPGLSIGDPNPWKNEQSQSSPPPPPAATNTPQLSELQTRFARMNSDSPAALKSPPAEGTTMEQKQAAFKTAQNFHRDPSSVTMADAQSAASTANNFRARHQDQISAGAQKANQWNKKFNVTSRVNTFLEKQSSPVSEQPPAAAALPLASPATSDVNAISRKPPPPPPPKKPAGLHAPPPVPIGTKPSFG